MFSSGARPIHALIIEGNHSIAVTYDAVLRQHGVPADVAFDLPSANLALRRQRYSLALIDLDLAKGESAGIVRLLTSRQPDCAVIVISDQESGEAALEATRAGASDYLVKPVSPERLALTLRNALETARLRATVREVESTGRFRFQGFIGKSPPMKALYHMIETISQSSAPVFILGESGTGKELCAQALHQLSQRAEAPMHTLNCAAIPRDLMESELFGHVRGAFTGATADRKGAALLADGGTLFLDELCELDINLQAKLLRLLQTGELRRVGENQTRRVDLRVICATNKDPRTEMQAGRLREDLFYRLYVLPLELPPLRERGSDILLLAHSMANQYAAEEGKKFREISKEGQALLMAHPWPGNVRELLNIIRAAVIFSVSSRIEAVTLAPLLDKQPRVAMASDWKRPQAAAAIAPSDYQASLVRPLAEVERDAISHAMTVFGGNMARAAKALGINTSTLYRKLKAQEAMQGPT
jgi:DNA-binding NtrC family response regulator